MKNKQEQEELTFTLQSSFELLYLAEHSLEFPRTKEQRKKCYQNYDKPCLRVYNGAMEAKGFIPSLPANKALDITLDVIERACLSKYSRMVNSVCYGGIMSLCFYNSPEQDTKILARVKNYPKKIQSMIFNTEFFWYHNRPDYHEWITYLSVTDVDWKHKNRKSFVLDLFRKSIDELEYDEKHWPFLYW